MTSQAYFEREISRCFRPNTSRPVNERIIAFAAIIIQAHRIDEEYSRIYAEGLREVEEQKLTAWYAEHPDAVERHTRDAAARDALRKVIHREAEWEYGWRCTPHIDTSHVEISISDIISAYPV